jgi:ligand-binding sensor domain-containing protein/signal transduction histidine kinase
VVGLAALCFAVSGSALDPARSVSQYLHDSWGAERGLPGESITAIAQTSDGYLWIGTDKDLIRFDGLNFRQFERAHPDPIQIGPVRTLVVDASDNLWILLQNTQVFRYHHGIFEPIRGWTEGGTTAMSRGTSGAVLLSSSAAGTLTYSENRFRSLSSPALLADAARVADREVRDERTTPFSWFDRLASPTSLVISMVQTNDGKIWLATDRRGLFYLQDDHISSVSSGRADTKINCFLPFQDSELWVGTSNGVLRWNGIKLTLAGVPSALLSLNVLSILRDRDSNIWIGTSRGLFRYNANGVSLLSTQGTTGPVTAIFEDREGNIWFGSTRGLERLRDSAFVMYALPNLKSQSAGPLHVDSGGRTWIAPIQGGLRWFKGGKSAAVSVDGIASDVVYSVAGIDEGSVWVGRQHGGLTHLRYSGNSLAAKTYTHADGLVQNSVYAVYESKDGTVWSGTLSGGVSKLKDGHFTNYTKTDGLASNTVSAIAEGTDGRMWFGAPAGLSELSKNGWRNYAVSDGLMSPDVSSLLRDSADVLWIGTSGGLAFLHNGRVQLPQGAQDWLREPVLGMAEDRNGWLWVATSTRVLRAKVSSLLHKQALDNSDFRVYGRDDGLQGTEGVKRFRSVVKDSQGNVWFSTNRGTSVVNPDRSTVNSLPPLLRVETVTVDGNEVNLQQPIRVPSGGHRIVFHYLGLSLANPERVRYRYSLDRFDRGWSEATSNRDATFANLGPGKYKFRVICSSGDNLWDNQGAAIDFSVLPTFFQTNWFRTLCVATFVALLWGMYQLRVRQLQRQFDIGLEARVNERTRIARELHDTWLQTLHALMFQFQAVRNLLPRRPEDAMRSLDDIIKETENALAESRNTIQGLRSESVARDSLAALLTAASKDLAPAGTAGQNTPIFDLIEEGERCPLSPNTNREVSRIALELLRNAYRHARATRIEAEVRYDDQVFCLRIRDNGTGIDSRVLKEGGIPGHWGLRGMRERAQRIGARLDFWSEAKAGTEVELAVPAKIAYQTPRHGSRFRTLRKTGNHDQQA